MELLNANPSRDNVEIANPLANRCLYIIGLLDARVGARAASRLARIRAVRKRTSPGLAFRYRARG
jgi:hypothetical protein